MVFDKADLRDIIFEARVVENDDPSNIQRVRVRVPKVHDAISKDSDLPWALKIASSMCGSGPGYGEYGVPDKGEVVYVEFQDGNPHNPIYYGNKVAAISGFSKDTYGFMDKKGNFFRVDKQSGEMTIQHFTGKYIKFLPDGSMEAEFGNTTVITEELNVTCTDATVDAQNVQVTALTMLVSCPSIDIN